MGSRPGMRPATRIYHKNIHLRVAILGALIKVLASQNRGSPWLEVRLVRSNCSANSSKLLGLEDNSLVMLRNKNLIRLSRQHQHALALCVRIERALQNSVLDLDTWQVEISQQYAEEIGFHFAAEEDVLFPVARRFPELVALAEELVDEHAHLRRHFERAKERKMDRNELAVVAKLLSGHIRKEERQLFEGMQRLVETGEMRRIGVALEKELSFSHQACNLPKRSGSE